MARYYKSVAESGGGKEMKFRWVLTILFMFETIGNILIIGKPRDSVTPVNSAIHCLITALLIYGVWNWL